MCVCVYASGVHNEGDGDVDDGGLLFRRWPSPHSLTPFSSPQCNASVRTCVYMCVFVYVSVSVVSADSVLLSSTLG